jgi:hypothetical protein
MEQVERYASFVELMPVRTIHVSSGDADVPLEMVDEEVDDRCNDLPHHLDEGEEEEE